MQSTHLVLSWNDVDVILLWQRQQGNDQPALLWWGAVSSGPPASNQSNESDNESELSAAID
jgi:hypothetical protein